MNQPPLWRAGAIATVAAVAVNVLIRLIAFAALPISPDNLQLGSVGPTITLTVFGALGATALFAIVRRMANRPASVFTKIAAFVLLISFIPDALLLKWHAPGTTAISVAVLMLMHVAAAVTIVSTLIRLGLPAHPAE
jgi:hypothetical protein